MPYGSMIEGASAGSAGQRAANLQKQRQPVRAPIAPRPAPTISYAPPPPAPRTYTSSTGSYSGGGAPSAPRQTSPGPQHPVGRAIDRRQQNQPAPEPKAPGLKDYLGGDVDYQNTLNDLLKNFEAVKTQTSTNKGNLQQDYNDTKGRLSKEQSDALEKMQADFAARGLLGSGVYENALNDFNLGYQNQFSDAETSLGRNMSSLMTSLADARRLYQQQKQDARLSAIRRRAEKYGLQ